MQSESGRVEKEGEKQAGDNGHTFYGQESISFLLSKAARHVAALLREELALYQITPSQFVVLMQLEEGRREPLVVLSGKTGIDRTTIALIVHRLEKKGLVLCLDAPEDRRAYRIVMTDKGLELKKELNIAAEKVHGRVTTMISIKGYDDLTQVLAKVLA